MVRSLWTAATGMNGQQANIDTISNNLSNVNTTGYKKQRVEFEDLLYQTIKTAGTPATEDTVTPVGVQMGTGVKVEISKFSGKMISGITLNPFEFTICPFESTLKDPSRVYA